MLYRTLLRHTCDIVGCLLLGVLKVQSSHYSKSAGGLDTPPVVPRPIDILCSWCVTESPLTVFCINYCHGTSIGLSAHQYDVNIAVYVHHGL